MRNGKGKHLLRSRLPEGYAEEGIYDDNDVDATKTGRGESWQETDGDVLETCVEGDESSTLVSPRSSSEYHAAVVSRQEKASRPQSANAACKKKGNKSPPKLPEGATGEYAERIRLSKPIKRTHSVGGHELSEVDLEVERRKGELLGGRHLGGGYRGANEPVTKNMSSTQGLIRSLAGSKSNGSMGTWVDLLNTSKGKRRATSAGHTRGRDSSGPAHLQDGAQVTHTDKEFVRGYVTSPEALARRQDVMEHRKIDRTQWPDSLRDESLSPNPSRRVRPSSAALAASGGMEKQGDGTARQPKPPFAVRSGEDLHTLA